MPNFKEFLKSFKKPDDDEETEFERWAKSINRPFTTALFSLLLASSHGEYPPLSTIDQIPGCSSIIQEMPMSDTFLDTVHEVMRAESLIISSNPFSTTMPLGKILYEIVSPDEFNHRIYNDLGKKYREKKSYGQTAWSEDSRGNKILLINESHLVDVGVSEIGGLQRVCDFTRLAMDVTARNIELQASSNLPINSFHMKFGDTSVRMKTGMGLDYDIGKNTPDGYKRTKSAGFSRGLSLMLAEKLMHTPQMIDQYPFLADPHLTYDVLPSRAKTEYSASATVLGFLNTLTPERIFEANRNQGPIATVDLLAFHYKKFYDEKYGINITKITSRQKALDTLTMLNENDYDPDNRDERNKILAQYNALFNPTK